MAALVARSWVRSAAAGAKRFSLKRSFASSAHHDEASEYIILLPEKEATKWEKITYAGIATCTILAIYNLSRGHHEFPDPPPYPYLHIRNKEFPWGPDGLFEKKKKHADR